MARAVNGDSTCCSPGPGDLRGFRLVRSRRHRPDPDHSRGTAGAQAFPRLRGGRRHRPRAGTGPRARRSGRLTVRTRGRRRDPQLPAIWSTPRSARRDSASTSACDIPIGRNVPACGRMRRRDLSTARVGTRTGSASPGRLEGLGWRFHRVWSTDWFYRNADAVHRLREALDSAQRQAAGGIAVTGANVGGVLTPVVAAPVEAVVEMPIAVDLPVRRLPPYQRRRSRHRPVTSLSWPTPSSWRGWWT